MGRSRFVKVRLGGHGGQADARHSVRFGHGCLAANPAQSGAAADDPGGGRATGRIAEDSLADDQARGPPGGEVWPAAVAGETVGTEGDDQQW